MNSSNPFEWTTIPVEKLVFSQVSQSAADTGGAMPGKEAGGNTRWLR